MESGFESLLPSHSVDPVFCFVSAKFGPLMIFLKRWFAYNKTTQGDMHEYQEEVIAWPIA